jgi:hypothetical protein
MVKAADHVDYTYTILSVANIILSSLVVITFFTSKRLRLHPSGIIVSLALSEMAATYHNLIFIWGEESVVTKLTLEKMRCWSWVGLNDETSIKKALCSINTTILILGNLAGILYNFILCIDLLLSLRNPFTSAYKRMPIYHAIVGVILATYGANLCYGESLVICIMKKAEDPTRATLFHKKLMMVLIFAYVFIGLLSISYAAYRIHSGIKISNSAMKQYLSRHIAYVSVNTVIWSVCCASYIYNINHKVKDTNDNPLNIITNYCLSIGGFILAIIRSTDAAFWQKITSGHIFLYEEEENQAEDDEWNTPISSLLSDLSAELGANIFESLYAVYSTKSPYFDKEITADMGKEKKEFSHSRPSRLAEYISLGNQSFNAHITEYSPQVFDYIRHFHGADNESIMRSVDPVNNIDSFITADESKGKSGSFFMFSGDQRIVIKTVKQSEVRTLVWMSKGYADHLKYNGKSLLCKIYGAFYMKFSGVSPIYIILMENVTCNMNPTRIYDLKGSTLNRITKSSEKDNGKQSVGPFKDLDFLKDKRKIELFGEDYESKAQAIINDSVFLKKFNVMDYSMLICIEDQAVRREIRYSIIDYLTSYGLFKRVERAFMVLLNPTSSKEASVINPEKYSNRFIGFLLNKVFIKRKTN